MRARSATAQTLRRLLGVGVLAATLAGCGRSGSTALVAGPTSTISKDLTEPTSAPSFSPVGACSAADLPDPGPATMPTPTRLATTQVYETGGVRLDPPAPSDVAQATPEQAWANADFEKRKDVQYQVVLARMSAQTPAKIGPNNQAIPLYQGTLVWMVPAHHIPVAPSFGGAPLAPGQTTVPRPPCGWLDGLAPTDAASGQRLWQSTFGSES